MFTAYFDETEADTVFLMAGWVATVDDWAAFTGAWTAVLVQQPTIRYFSHHEAQARKGEFAGWEEDVVDAKRSALVDVICAHPMYGLTTGVRTTTWNAAFASRNLPAKRLKSILKFTHPYQACFHSAIAAVLHLQTEKAHLGTVVDFVFDEQTGLLKESIKAYRTFREGFAPDLRELAGSVSVGNDKLLRPLQAADLLCGQLGAMLSSKKPGMAYKRLAASHEIARVRAYPANFSSVPALVADVARLAAEKWSLDQFLKLTEKLAAKKN
jgi:hypothetical protein